MKKVILFAICLIAFTTTANACGGAKQPDGSWNIKYNFTRNIYGKTYLCCVHNSKYSKSENCKTKEEWIQSIIKNNFDYQLLLIIKHNIQNCFECEKSGNSVTCSECKEGYYRNNQGKCQSCNIDNCKTCQRSGMSFSCTTCKEGFTLTNNQCQPNQNNNVCDPGYYKNPSTSNCEQCPTHCAVCSDSATCSECFAPYTKTETQHIIFFDILGKAELIDFISTKK